MGAVGRLGYPYNRQRPIYPPNTQNTTRHRTNARKWHNKLGGTPLHKHSLGFSPGLRAWTQRMSNKRAQSADGSGWKHNQAGKNNHTKVTPALLSTSFSKTTLCVDVFTRLQLRHGMKAGLLGQAARRSSL